MITLYQHHSSFRLNSSEQHFDTKLIPCRYSGSLYLYHTNTILTRVLIPCRIRLCRLRGIRARVGVERDSPAADGHAPTGGRARLGAGGDPAQRNTGHAGDSYDSVLRVVQYTEYSVVRVIQYTAYYSIHSIVYYEWYSMQRITVYIV